MSALCGPQFYYLAKEIRFDTVGKIDKKKFQTKARKKVMATRASKMSTLKFTLNLV